MFVWGEVRMKVGCEGEGVMGWVSVAQKGGLGLGWFWAMICSNVMLCCLLSHAM